MQASTFGYVCLTALVTDQTSCQHSCSLIGKGASHIAALDYLPFLHSGMCLQWRQMLCEAVEYTAQYFWQLTGC